MAESNGRYQKFNQSFKDAQVKAVHAAKEFEQEARKMVETLQDRAQAEAKVLIKQAKGLSRTQLVALGVELEKLGKRLQKLADEPAASPVNVQ